MNGFRYICFACLAALFPSCVKDDCSGKGNDDGQVTVNLSFTTRMDENTGEDMETDGKDAENRIETVRVYVFDGNDSGARLVGYHYADLSGKNLTEISFDIRLGFSRYTIPDAGYECWFYAIANEKQAGEMSRGLPEAGFDSEKGGYVWKGESDGITPDVLAGVTFTKLPKSTLIGEDTGKDETNKEYSAPVLPMAVVQKNVIRKDTETLTLPLERSVAKMELYFAKGGIGEGRLYIGRGLYLYNIPKKGYLFPKDDITLPADEIGNREDKNGICTDSQYQMNGLPILHCGLDKDAVSPDEVAKLHINEITKKWNNRNPDNGTDGRRDYQWLPRKAVYLFANPHTTQVAGKEVTGNGYYMKLLHHSHENSEAGVDEGESHIDYVTLPKVEPNMFVKAFLVIPLDGYTKFQAYWEIGDWNSVDIPDITFD